MRFWSLCDHRCRARSAHRTRNLKFVLRTYANASSQRVHRVSKRLHKTCAKPPKTPSSKKSGFFVFFSLPSFLGTQAIATTAGARQLAPTPAEGRCPTPTVGLVGASPCGTRPKVARPQPTQRVSDAPTPASIHVDRERSAPPTPRHAALGAPHPSLQPTLRRSRRNGRSGTCCAVRSVGVVGAKPRSHATPFDARFLATHNHSTHAKPTDHHDLITSHPALAQSPLGERVCRFNLACEVRTQRSLVSYETDEG